MVTHLDEFWHRKYTEDDEGRSGLRRVAADDEVDGTPRCPTSSIHMPSPSYWPLVLALGLPISATGSSSELVARGVGAVIVFFGLYGWAIEPATGPEAPDDEDRPRRAARARHARGDRGRGAERAPESTRGGGRARGGARRPTWQCSRITAHPRSPDQHRRHQPQARRSGCSSRRSACSSARSSRPTSSTAAATPAVLAPTPDELFNIPFTSVTSFILLMSSLTMVLALAAIQRGDHRRAAHLAARRPRCSGATFIGGQVYEFTEFYREGLRSRRTCSASTFFVLTGLHGAHVTIGIIWLLSLWGLLDAGPAAAGEGRGGRDRRALLALRRRRVDLHLHRRLPDPGVRRPR